MLRGGWPTANGGGSITDCAFALEGGMTGPLTGDEERDTDQDEEFGGGTLGTGASRKESIIIVSSAGRCT